MKTTIVVSPLASLGLLVGLALAQTAPAQPSPGGQGTSTEQPQPGESMGGGQSAGTAPNPSQGTANELPAETKSGGQAGAVEGGNLPAGAVANQATKHIAVVSAALVSGAANANMLKQIAAHPATYDPDHGQIFITNVKQAVTQADENLAHLKPMARGKEISQIEDLQGRIDKVKDMLPKMEGELTNPTALGSDAGACASQLHGGMGPLKNVSSTMHAKVTLGSTG